MSEPKRLVEPGNYRCRWQVSGQQVAGALEIRPNRRALLEVDQLVPSYEGHVMQFGEPVNVPRLEGQLLTNEDVVALDVRVERLFPGRDLGLARFAIIGMGVAAVPNDLYPTVTVQMTGGDKLFGALPFSSFSHPGRPESRPGEYSVTLREDVVWTWDSTSEGIEVTCQYVPAASVHRYGFNVSVMPVIQLRSAQPLELREWVDRWIVPLVETATFATRERQQIAALTVSTGGDRPTRGAVFGPGIAQQPYYSSDGRDWAQGPKSLFSIADLPVDLVALLVRWRTLLADRNPFMELYRLVLMTDELPMRAKLLYLFQALEALHGVEHQAEDDAAQAAYEERRLEALDEVRRSCDKATSKFLRKALSNRRPDSLARRLRALLDDLPADVSRELRSPEVAALRAEPPDDEGELVEEQLQSLEEQLQALRNDLSHGRSRSEEELEAWIDAVEVICESSMLRLLGFDSEAIAARLERAV